jgi:hypothetical protein
VITPVLSAIIMGGPWQPLEISIYGENLAADLNQALTKASLRLQSDPIERGKRQPGGVLDLGPDLGGVRVTFSVPRANASLGWFGDVNFRLAPMTMSRATAEVKDGCFLISGLFEAKGMKILAQHTSLGSLELPTVGIQRGKVVLKMRPMVDPKGRPTYSRIDVTFQSIMKSSGLNFSFRGRTIDLLNSVSGYQAVLAKAVEDRLEEFLNSRGCREAFTFVLNRALTKRAAELGFKVTRIRNEGTDFFATVERL